MVLHGQYLERPTLIARGPVTLEGLFHRGESAPAVVVCAPHPALGGSMDSPVVAELAWALTRAGHATLRFNYQGVGASGGTRRASAPPSKPLPVSALASEIDDARAAAEQLALSTPHRRVALCGYSFGAAVALGLALATPDSTPLLLVAPPTGLFDFAPLATLDRSIWIACGDRDGHVDGARLGELARANRRIALELVGEADHFFSRGLSELGARAAAFLAGRDRRDAPDDA